MMNVEFSKQDYHVGERLVPPIIRFRNAGEEALELVGPILTVVGGAMADTAGNQINLAVAMPTGRDPYDFPRKRLHPGGTRSLQADQIAGWQSTTGYINYAHYGLDTPGTYTISFMYEGVSSNTVTIRVRPTHPAI